MQAAATGKNAVSSGASQVSGCIILRRAVMRKKYPIGLQRAAEMTNDLTVSRSSCDE